jgi:enoyl-CoA hydratase
MASEYVTLEMSGTKATITLDRPDQHNKLGVDELGALILTLEHLENQPGCRVVVLTGAGSKTFCSGFDIDQIKSVDWAEEPFEQAVSRLEALSLPTICALNGSVYGGGAELALACDFRIGIEGSRLCLPAAEIGVHYGVRGLERFYARLGLRAAKRILLAAESLESHELLHLGYFDWLVEATTLQERTDQLAQRLAALAPLAVRGMKRALNQISYGTLDEAAAKQAISECFGSSDINEGIAAKTQNRAPAFTGQ